MCVWRFAVGGTAVLNLAAKYTFGRVYPDFWLSIVPETTFSFLSGHAIGSIAPVRSLDVLEVHEAFCVVSDALIGEIERADAALAIRLASPLRALVRAVPR